MGWTPETGAGFTAESYVKAMRGASCVRCCLHTPVYALRTGFVGQFESKRRALAELRVHVDFAPEETRELACEGKAESGSAES